MGTKISILSDNSAGIGFLGEWGFSCLIERGNTRILFDTGTGSALICNARRLNIDLSAIDAVLLSHGHGDHTCGLLELLNGRKKVTVIGHPDLWNTKYFQTPGNGMQYIGIPYRREALENQGMVFQETVQPLDLGEGMVTSGVIPLTSTFEEGDKNLFIGNQETFQPDLMVDEIALYLKTQAGLVIITGCSHRGIVNTIQQARNLTGIKTVQAVIGGFHLFPSPSSFVQKTIQSLQDMEIQALYPCHCTGFSAQAMFAREMPETFRSITTGTVLELPCA